MTYCIFLIACSLTLPSPLLAQVPARTLWSASSVLDTAIDLLEQGDSIFRERSDPLLESINAHGPGTAENNIINTRDVPEKFLVPMLSNVVGDNNQLMEYMTAAVVARATNRTLCLTQFFSGPSRHGGQLLRRQGAGLAVEDRYSIHSLTNFVRVSPLERCFKSCNKHLDSFWWLRRASSSHLTVWLWDHKNVKTHDLDWSFVKWTSTNDVYNTFQGFEHERCVALGGLFPGVRWRGAYLACSSFLRPSESMWRAATALQERAIGANHSFLAVHWRFEESNCKGHELGLCFTRCRDGAVIDSGLHPAGVEWVAELSKQKCKLRGVLLTKEDIVAAIREKAKKENVDLIYIATDGWMRGKRPLKLVQEVVNKLRRSGLAVVGLWKIDHLPNFSDGSYLEPAWLKSLVPNLSGHTISQLEQEICTRARVFLGSGESTWSLSVFRSRLALRKAEQIRQDLRAKGTLIGQEARENEEVIERLLGDEHAAGLQCRYAGYYGRAKVNSTAETYEDEEPDGWLDMEACEKRIGKGGNCKLAACV